MNKKLDYIVFIGRFQLFHIGHELVLDKAFELAKRVIVLVGSSNQPRRVKNPWSFEEREYVIRTTYRLKDIHEDRLIILPIRDKMYNDTAWAQGVQKAVDDYLTSEKWTPTDIKGMDIGIIGHNKDETSFYLNLFPQWGTPIEPEMMENISASEIRKIYFERQNMKFLKASVSPVVFDFLENFKKKPDYELLVREYEHQVKYIASWANTPYPVIHNAVDAVIVQSGHILLVRRRAAPGEGLWALPGGHVGHYERFEDAYIRELREETKLKVAEGVLRGYKQMKLFDAPHRSEIGRMVTHAYFVELKPGPLPKVKGDDDADKARWWPLHEVDEKFMFDDHFHIIEFFTGSFE